MPQPTRGNRSLRRARSLVAVVTVAAAIVGGGPAALATDTFRFHGSGYGHGIGMSQWGAYGLARPGGKHVARIPGGDTWTVTRSRTRSAYAIRNESGRLVGGRRWGGPASPLFA